MTVPASDSSTLPQVFECVDLAQDVYIYRGQEWRGRLTREQVEAHTNYVILTPKDPALYC